MTTPDLAALRALVEAVAIAIRPHSVMETSMSSNTAREIAAVRTALPAAQEALKRLEQIVPLPAESALADLRALVARAGTTTVYCSCYSCQAIRPLVPAAQAALDRLEKDTTNLMNTNNYSGVPKSEKVQAAEDAARIAQSARDVAYWRRRAESAEAMVQWQDITRQRGPVVQGDAATTAMEGRDE